MQDGRIQAPRLAVLQLIGLGSYRYSCHSIMHCCS